MSWAKRIEIQEHAQGGVLVIVDGDPKTNMVGDILFPDVETAIRRAMHLMHPEWAQEARHC